MSRSTTHSLTCPCGEVFEHTTYEYVNITQDPQLRYIVLAGMLNVATCPNCGRKAATGRPFIYSDPAHQLLAFVHPRHDAPQEARIVILEQLRTIYNSIVSETADQLDPARGTGDTLATDTPAQVLDTPQLQVVFGIDQLQELINAALDQSERLGRVALSTRSSAEAERGQMLDIARKMAGEMGCQIEVDDLPDEYTVWIYGPRRSISTLMHELATQS